MKNNRFLPYFLWILSVTFFGYQFIMRLAPGLVVEELMNSYGITASKFGLFSAIYYIGYSAFQIPIAYMLEKYSVRLILGALVLIASLGTFVLSFTESFYLALFGRFLIGLGSAGGFLGVSKIISSYFPRKEYSKMVGYSFSLGLLGAIYGGKPVRNLIEQFGYNNTFLLIAAFGFVIATLILIFCKNNKHKEHVKPSGSMISELKDILKNKTVVFMSVANLLMVGSLEGFADVWGVTFLTKSLSVNKSDAAMVISYIFVGMLFGGPILAFMSNKVWNKNIWVFLCGLFTFVIFSVVLLVNNLNINFVYFLMLMNGILCCYQVLVFSIGSEIVPEEKQSMTIAFLNCINMLGGTFFHTAIGFTLDYLNKGSSVEIHSYTLEQYKYAMFVIPASSLIGGLVFLYVNSRKKIQ